MKKNMRMNMTIITMAVISFLIFNVDSKFLQDSSIPSENLHSKIFEDNPAEFRSLSSNDRTLSTKSSRPAS